MEASRRLAGEVLQEPRSYTLACADAGMVLRLRRPRWANWGMRNAYALGDLLVNDCTPTCADGSDVSYPVTAVASELQLQGKYATYRQLRISWANPAHRPTGTARSGMIYAIDTAGPRETGN